MPSTVRVLNFGWLIGNVLIGIYLNYNGLPWKWFDLNPRLFILQLSTIVVPSLLLVWMLIVFQDLNSGRGYNNTAAYYRRVGLYWALSIGNFSYIIIVNIYLMCKQLFIWSVDNQLTERFEQYPTLVAIAQTGLVLAIGLVNEMEEEVKRQTKNPNRKISQPTQLA